MLPCLFTSMDLDHPKLTSRAAALLRAVTTTLWRRIIKMGVVARMDSHIFQWFAFRTYVAVLLRHVGEPVNAIETTRVGIFFHSDVSFYAALIKPLQHFAVAVGGIRGHRLEVRPGSPLPTQLNIRAPCGSP